MKKVLFLLVVFTVVLSACASKKDANKQELENRKDGSSRGFDYEQPERKPDVIGLVKSVVGNQVTIMKLDVVGNREKKNEESEDDRKTGLTLGGSAKKQGMRGGGGFGGVRSEGDMTSMIQRMKEMSTGEEVVIVPVGIQMLKTGLQRGQGMEEAFLTDISQEKMISVWLDEDVEDRKIATFVLIKK